MSSVVKRIDGLLFHPQMSIIIRNEHLYVVVVVSVCAFIEYSVACIVLSLLVQDRAIVVQKIGIGMEFPIQVMVLL